MITTLVIGFWANWHRAEGVDCIDRELHDALPEDVRAYIHSVDRDDAITTIVTLSPCVVDVVTTLLRWRFSDLRAHVRWRAEGESKNENTDYSGELLTHHDIVALQESSLADLLTAGIFDRRLRRSSFPAGLRDTLQIRSHRCRRQLLARRDERRKTERCPVCGDLVFATGSRAEISYMATDAAWRAAALERGVVACLPCFEKRLGRPVCSSDFSRAPINRWIHRALARGEHPWDARDPLAGAEGR